MSSIGAQELAPPKGATHSKKRVGRGNGSQGTYAGKGLKGQKSRSGKKGPYDAFEGGQVVAQARELNGALPIIARAHSEVEIEHLRKHGATKVVMGEHEIAKAMIADIPPGRA